MVIHCIYDYLIYFHLYISKRHIPLQKKHDHTAMLIPSKEIYTIILSNCKAKMLTTMCQQMGKLLA